MESWIYIGSGIGLFSLFFLMVNSFQLATKRSAYVMPLQFGPVFAAFVVIPVLLFVELRQLFWLPGLYSMAGLVIVSVVFGYIWQTYVPYKKSTEYKNFPFILLVSPTSTVMKCLDIMLQQLCAYLIYIGLLAFGWPLWQVIVSFVLVVFILHLPSEKFFGRFFGRYFLVVSTALAFSIPLLVSLDTRYIYLTFAIHVVGYWILYWLVYQYTIEQHDY